MLSYQNPQNPQSRPQLNSNAPPTGHALQSSYQNRPTPPTPQPLHPHQPQTWRRQSSPNSPPNLNSTFNRNDHISSPSMQNYSFNPQIHSRPGAFSPPPPRPPTTPLGVQGSNDVALFPLFKAVDKRGMGKLTEVELRTALVNGDFTQFDPHTVRMMIRMFDTDRDGTIGFDEFWY